LALAAETGFLRFKEQVPHNFKNKISAVKGEWKTSMTPVSFRWTVPLSSVSAH
jgi:hypothetical protein